MLVSMYSVKAFDVDLRAGFRLSADPYLEDEQTMEYLRWLGVVFYRSELMGANGLVIELQDGNPVSIVDRGAIKGCFAHQVDLTDDLRVARWENPTAKHIRKHGDDFIWLKFNYPGVILSISSTAVTFV